VQALSTATSDEFSNVRFVLTDMDETLTYRGRLAAQTYFALERLQENGVRVIPVTAAPAGWCDQMARMWPVDGVIGENGGLFFRRDDAAIGAHAHALVREFWHGDAVQDVATQLQTIAARVQREVPEAVFADDQPFRTTSVAFSIPRDATARDRIADALRRAGADVTVNNLWILGWLGGYDKLSMSRRILAAHYGVDLDAEAGRSSVLYTGDSTNDAPMFAFFRHTVGVSTVVDYLDRIPVHPRWITQGPGGAGFVEAADAVIAARANRDR
jgi:HAD superfamily hydrolase (TIGR01484 family)